VQPDGHVPVLHRLAQLGDAALLAVVGAADAFYGHLVITLFG